MWRYRARACLPDFLTRAATPLVRQVLSLYPDSLVVAAMKAGGGPELGMEAITEPFEVLCGALREEAQLHGGGIIAARRMVVRSLATRGKAVRLLAQHPEIDAIAVPAPIVITGLPHTGTEMLADRLATAPGLRRPDGPQDLMAVHMASMAFELAWHVPAYAEWYDEADLTPAYGWLRRLLQLQQRSDHQRSDHQRSDQERSDQEPVRWVVRSMQHLEQLPALRAVFPDAVVVQTHRDIGPVLEETTRSVAELRRRSSAEVNPTQIGRYWSWRAERMLERNAAARQRDHELRIVDVDHDELMDDPAGIVAELLVQLGAAPES